MSGIQQFPVSYSTVNPGPVAKKRSESGLFDLYVNLYVNLLPLTVQIVDAFFYRLSLPPLMCDIEPLL